MTYYIPANLAPMNIQNPYYSPNVNVNNTSQ